MSSDAAAPRPVRRHLALLHGDELAVALDPVTRGLPHDEVAEPESLAGLEELAAPLGTRAAVLVTPGFVDGEVGARHVLHLAEPLPGAAPVRDEVAWWRPGDDPPAGLPEPLVTALAQGLRAAVDPSDGRRAAYARRGGTARLARALAEALEPPGGARIHAGPDAVRQYRAWCLSSVWMHERLVVKASLPMWSHEGSVTAHLAAIAPDVVPGVHAHGLLRGPDGRGTPWLVQDRVHGRRAGDGIDDRVRLAGLLGGLQVRVARSADRGAGPSAPDRGVATLRRGLERVAASSELGGLAEHERAGLGVVWAELGRAIDALEALAAPPLLAHGDLHGGNAIVHDHGLAIIDWTDAAFTFPGVDLATLIGFDQDLGDARWRPVVEAYLRAVRPLLGPDADELVALGLDLALAYHAVSYADIAAEVPDDSSWQVEGTVRYLVRRLLARPVPA